MGDIKMSDGLEKRPEVVEAKVMNGIRYVDLVLPRDVETDGQYDARMKREKAFLELQREIVRPWVGEKIARSVEDYHEAGLPMGLGALVSGKNAVEEVFVQQRVLGCSLSQRIERYRLEMSEHGKMKDKKSTELYSRFVDFNPDVLYVAFTFPSIIRRANEEEDYNLFVLRKSALKPGERIAVVRRANKLIDVLRYSGEFYGHKNRLDPWSALVQMIQGVSLRAEPMQDVDFGKTGRVVGWTKASEEDEPYYHAGGMLVESPDVEMSPILINASNKRKFGHLEGLLIRYHFAGYEDGYPYGDLVATSLGIPIDDTPRLSP